jgi:hypothetical protein
VTGPAKSGRKQGSRFKKGQSGNPAGRPQGSRSKVTLAMDALLDGEAENLTRKAIELALEGDMAALRLCLDRLCPPRKERAIHCNLPAIGTPADAVAAMTALVESVAIGNLTPGEGQALAGMIDVHRRVVEHEDHERRLAALEKEAGLK